MKVISHSVFFGVLLQLERHVADADFAHGEVGPVHLPLLAELRQELHGLHKIPVSSLGPGRGHDLFPDELPPEIPSTEANPFSS